MMNSKVLILKNERKEDWQKHEHMETSARRIGKGMNITSAWNGYRGLKHLKTSSRNRPESYGDMLRGGDGNIGTNL